MAKKEIKSVIFEAALAVEQENNDSTLHDKKAYFVQAIVQGLGSRRDEYTIRVPADSEQQAVILANKEAKKYGTVISSKVLDDK